MATSTIMIRRECFLKLKMRNLNIRNRIDVSNFGKKFGKFRFCTREPAGQDSVIENLCKHNLRQLRLYCLRILRKIYSAAVTFSRFLRSSRQVFQQ